MKKIYGGIILAIGMGLLVGCAQEKYKEIPSRRGEVTSSGIRLGGIFRMNESGTPRSLDPVRVDETASHHIAEQIYDALFKFDDSLQLQAGLAERYEISDDGKVYTFYLRKGVRFHDDPCFPDGKGREVKAEDVAYSFSRVLNPTFRSTGVWLFENLVEGAKDYMEGKAESVAGFRVIDEYTFQIRLTKPFSPFRYRLSMSYCFVVPHEAVEYYKEDFFQHPVGTGPFQFVYWKPNEEVLLKRNPHYWKKDKAGNQLPYLDGISIAQINDFKIAFLELDLGNLEMVQQIHEDIWTKIFDENNQVRTEYQQYQIQNKALWVTQYYGFNLTKPPFKDNRKLRQAFNYAVDRQAIIDYVINGRGLPAKGIVPAGLPGYSSRVKGYQYDPEKAKQLLAEAGYPNGEGLGEITLQLNSGGTVNETIAEAVQSQLQKFGIHIRLQVVDWAQHLESIDNNQPVFYRLGWVADYPDPENFLQLLWGENIPPGGPNYSRYNNPEYNHLFVKALETTDFDQQLQWFQEAEEIAVNDAPWLFLFYTVRFRMLQPYVRNMVYNAQELPFLTEVWLDAMPDESKDVQ